MGGGEGGSSLDNAHPPAPPTCETLVDTVRKHTLSASSQYTSRPNRHPVPNAFLLHLRHTLHIPSRGCLDILQTPSESVVGSGEEGENIRRLPKQDHPPLLLVVRPGHPPQAHWQQQRWGHSQRLPRPAQRHCSERRRLRSRLRTASSLTRRPVGGRCRGRGSGARCPRSLGRRGSGAS